MEARIRTNLDNIYSDDKQLQGQAYMYLLEETRKPVGWAYEAWDEILAATAHKNNRVRSIASQLLCNLAKSDPDGRMLNDFEALLEVTRDERFVTARHCLQSIWKVGLVGEAHRELVIQGLDVRFRESTTEKNGTLMRFDILQVLWNLYENTGVEDIRAKALQLIETEGDPKYRKKYARLWNRS
jgi:hypothetical protein